MLSEIMPVTTSTMFCYKEGWQGQSITKREGKSQVELFLFSNKMNNLAWTLLLACITLAACKPLHHLQKRTVTLTDIVGDLTAEQAGIINKDFVPMSDCKKLRNSGQQTKSGIYTINPNDGKGEFNVFCDMNLNEGGWTVIQRRIDNTTSFNRNRDEYNVGFGSFNGNFWLGLEKMKRITDTGTYELYIGLQSFLSSPSDLAWAKYGSFSLGTDANDYTLSISSHDGTSTAGDSLTAQNSKKFSTPDEDNDSSGTHCASVHSAGWWYASCKESHLNGVYYYDGSHPTSTTDGILWNAWLDETPLKTAVMAIRPT